MTQADDAQPHANKQAWSVAPQESSVEGVYVAGDASRDVLLIAVAIAEGAKAGVAINRALLIEDGLC